MGEALVTLLAALLGTLVGGGITYGIQKQQQEAQAKLQLDLQEREHEKQERDALKRLYIDLSQRAFDTWRYQNRYRALRNTESNNLYIESLMEFSGLVHEAEVIAPAEVFTAARKVYEDFLDSSNLENEEVPASDVKKLKQVLREAARNETVSQHKEK